MKTFNGKNIFSVSFKDENGSFTEQSFNKFFKYLSDRIYNIFLKNAYKIYNEKTNNAGLYESEQEQVDAYFRL